MSGLALFFAPGACSRVALIALEESGAPFRTELISLMIGEHRSARYLGINPSGKVPTLVANGVPLTENVAILTYLARAFPDAKLLPLAGNLMEDAQILSQLAWCASGLHPIVTRLRRPEVFCDRTETLDRVRQMAVHAMALNFSLIEARLARHPWMLGNWSVLDAYVYWVWSRVTGAGIDGSKYPRYCEHALRMESRPSVQRALGREEDAQAYLDGQGFGPRDW